MPPGRGRRDRRPAEPRGGLCQSRNVVSAGVLMQIFLGVCREKLLYYTASAAVLRSNRNFGIYRFFKE